MAAKVRVPGLDDLIDWREGWLTLDGDEVTFRTGDYGNTVQCSRGAFVSAIDHAVAHPRPPKLMEWASGRGVRAARDGGVEYERLASATRSPHRGITVSARRTFLFGMRVYFGNSVSFAPRKLRKAWKKATAIEDAELERR